MNQNPTDTNNRPLVVGADYYINENIPHVEYKGQENLVLFGWRLRFTYSNGVGVILRPVDFHPTRLEGQAGGRRNSKSKRRKMKRRKSRKNKSRRRR